MIKHFMQYCEKHCGIEPDQLDETMFWNNPKKYESFLDFLQ